MSTSDPDLEDRLAALRPPPPRADLRDEVLAAVRADLADAARIPFLDHLLAKRATWTSAAAVLLALVVASVWTDRAAEQRLEALAARPPTANRPLLHAWRERDALLARLLATGDRDE